MASANTASKAALVKAILTKVSDRATFCFSLPIEQHENNAQGCWHDLYIMYIPGPVGEGLPRAKSVGSRSHGTFNSAARLYEAHVMRTAYTVACLSVTH